MTLKIEVGDKVRIVRVHSGVKKEWGVVGEVGKVRSCNVGYGLISGVGKCNAYLGESSWWHPIAHLALFADELEDMPEDTAVTFGEPGKSLRHLGAGEACRRFRVTP